MGTSGGQQEGTREGKVSVWRGGFEGVTCVMCALQGQSGAGEEEEAAGHGGGQWE